MEARVTEVRRDVAGSPTGDELGQQRLDHLVAINARIARDKRLYRSDRERFEAAIMVRPVDARDAFATFGLLIGGLPLATVTMRIALESRFDQWGEQLYTVLFAIAALATGVVGFRLGKHVPAVVERSQNVRFPNRIAIYSLIGMAWGMLAGVAGGVFLLLIGAFFGAFIGGFIGALTAPVFIVLFELLRRGDRIEMKHLLPVAAGISLAICGLIAGF